MIQNLTVYYDNNEMSAKEALHAATAAARDRPTSKGGFEYDIIRLPNGKDLHVMSNEALTQIRVCEAPR